MRNKVIIWGSVLAILALSGCGFHLRGLDGGYQFPYKKTFLQCDTTVICQQLTATITHENLTKLVTNKESAEATIVVSNEQTSRDDSGYNASGQLANYLLTYQITAQVFDRVGNQVGQTIVVQHSETMNYNNSLILSAQMQEQKSWDNIHQAVISSLIRRIVYSHPELMSSNNVESK